MTYGTSTRHLEFPGVTLAHKFVLADVTKPLLGADFFNVERTESSVLLTAG